MAGGYSVTISATDAASSVINSVNKSLEALNKRVTLAQAPFKRLSENFDKFTKITGLDKIATGFGDVARAGTQSFQSLLRVIEPLAAITGAASLAGMYKLVSVWGEFATVLGNQAARAGLSADALFTLQNAAKLAGVSADSLTTGMTGLNDNMRNAAFGAAPEFLNVLRNLKNSNQGLAVSYDELKRQSPEQQLRTIATALSRMRDPTDQAMFATKLFGGAAEGLLPFLRQGAEGIDRFAARSRELTGAFTPQMLKNAQDFRVAQDGVTLAVTGLGNAIANVLGPVFTPLLDDLSRAVVGMRQWIEVNQDWLRGEISAKVGEFVTWLQGINWTAIGEGVKAIGTQALALGAAFSGLGTTGKEVVEIIGVAWLTGMLAPLVTLTAAFVQLTFVIGTGLAGAFRLAGIAADAFNSRAMALPIFRVMAVTMGVLDTLHQGIRVDTLPADSPLRREFEARETAGQEGGREGREGADQNDGIGGFLRRHLPERLGGTPAGSTPVPAAPLAPGERQRNAAAMDQVFEHEFGFTREFSAALIGGAVQESGLNPRSGAGTAHQGIFQHDAERRAAIEARTGQPLTSLSPADQARALATEITTMRRFADVNRLAHSTHDLTEANRAATERVEAPGHYDVEVPHRLRLSQGVLDALPAAPTVAPSPVSDPAPAADGTTAQRSSNSVRLPSATGSPGATGRVDVNVRVLGAPTVVSGQTSGGPALNIANPGLLGHSDTSDDRRGY